MALPPSLHHSSQSLPPGPGVPPKIDCLYTNSCLQLCFWRNPKPQLFFLSFLPQSPLLVAALFSQCIFYSPPVYLGDSVSQARLSVRESEIPSAHCSSELWSLHHHITEGEEGGRGRERTKRKMLVVSKKSLIGVRDGGTFPFAS